MDDLIGRTIKGTLEITARIGEGAMGSVYRAVDTATGRHLAIKIMQPGRMREPGMLMRFRREATAMRRVRHPNAVEVVSHGVDQGLVYLAMELVEGLDLAEHLAVEKHLAPERAARIVADVCSALVEAHAHGVVHRDIKPDNVMLGGASADVVKLIDFGIAKPNPLPAQEDDADDDVVDRRSVHDSIPDSVDLLDVGELTTAGMLIGSPGYMAPEQWSSSEVDGRADVYACGVLLYQLVTGRLPFEDTHPFMVAQRQLYEEPRAPHELNHEVPLALSAIILRAMRPAREERWQTATELRDALREFLVGQTVAGPLDLAATIPLETMSPMAGPATQPLPDLPAVPLDRTIVLDELPAVVPVYSEPAVAALAAFTSASIGRSGRPTPVPPPSLARSTSRPHSPGALALGQLRVVLPLCAAFLTLGFVLGLLILMPVMR
jgi:serine/threonine protein kinase